MLTPTPRFHVAALALVAPALVILVLPRTGFAEPIILAAVVGLSTSAVVCGIASFFEPGAHILTKMFSGVALIAALSVGGIAISTLTRLSTSSVL